MPPEILVVEDEPAIAEMIKFGLERAGYRIVLAPNGQEALSRVSQHNPDLIISDILMPVMDGYAFYKELKKNPATSRLPVLILTARGKMEDSFRVMGVDDFIVKPLDVDVLLSKIESYLKKAIPQPQKTTNKNILVVGSSPAIVQNIAVQLQKKGCVVETTTRGLEVVAQAVRFNPAVILIEVTMGPVSPEAIIRAIRSAPQFKRTATLVYSLKLSLARDSRLHCLEAGADEYIGPSSGPLFAETIEKYLD